MSLAISSLVGENVTVWQTVPAAELVAVVVTVVEDTVGAGRVVATVVVAPDAASTLVPLLELPEHPASTTRRGTNKRQALMNAFLPPLRDGYPQPAGGAAPTLTPWTIRASPATGWPFTMPWTGMS